MNYKRAITAGLMAFLINILFMLFAAVIFAPDIAEGQIPQNVWYFGMATAMLATTITTVWYFRDKKTKKTPKNGIMLGFIILVVSFILDGLSYIPFMNDEAITEHINTYYTSPFFWATMGLVVITSTGVAKYLSEKEKEGEN